MQLMLAENIRMFRKQRKLTQEKLAEALGVTVGAVYKWEAGLSQPELNLVAEMEDFFYFLIAFSLGFFAIGILISNANIPINTAIMRIVGRDKLSKVSSIISIGSQGMTPIAAVLAGIILNAFGSTALLAFCTLGFAVTAVILLFSPQIKEL